MGKNPLGTVCQCHSVRPNVSLAITKTAQRDKVFNLVDPTTGIMKACAIMIDDTTECNTTTEVAS